MPEYLDHLPLPPPKPEPHRVVGGGGTSRPFPSRTPETHAQMLLAELSHLGEEFARIQAVERPSASEGFLVRAEMVQGSPAHVEGLGDKRSGTLVVDRTPDGALVHHRTGSLQSLRTKIQQYADPEKTSEKTGLRKNTALVAPLESLRLATLSDLSDGWLRPDALGPQDRIWVELWAGGGELAEPGDRERAREALRTFLQVRDMPSDELASFVATEHDIYLVELTGAALMDLPVQLPDVYRLTPPEKVIVPRLLEEQFDIGAPRAGAPPGDAATVAILDTGIAEQHPLLRSAMAGNGASLIPGNPSAGDAQGHGTRMAGVAAYSDLAGALANGQPLQPRCALQNMRILAGGDHPEPEFMLDRTRDAVLEAEQVAGDRRIFSLAVGARTSAPGDSTPWSVAVDRLAYNDGGGRLFCVAAGNEPLDKPPLPGSYPAANLSAGLTSPGEAYNALTVGAITDRQTMDSSEEGRRPVAAQGELAPASRCDVGRNRPIKPDVVAEGGNLSTDDSTCRLDRSMQLLTACYQHAAGPWLTTTGQTSAATASIAGTLAEIWRANPRRRPETIRALLVHSARWTPAMRSQFPDRSERCRAVGYGTPRVDAASWSENQRPTLILEDVIRPERKLQNGREMHLVQLPLPESVLEQLRGNPVELSVTLSYFIEPNENRVRRYQGAGLRWGIQRPLESLDSFRKRINQLERAQDDDYENDTEDLPWEIGPQARGRGTVQSDRARVDAGELAGGRAIAVWPVSGWWRDRGVREDAGLRYSLVVTIDAGDESVDLYAPILNQISIETEIR